MIDRNAVLQTINNLEDVQKYICDGDCRNDCLMFAEDDWEECSIEKVIHGLDFLAHRMEEGK